MSKIILIEDDVTMVTLLNTLLQIEGYQVVRLKNEDSIEKVLDLMRREEPDLVLRDVHLRYFNGLDFLRSLRADPNFNDTRVIMSSGMDVRDQCHEAGADKFLMKPFMPDDLTKAIRLLINP